VTMITPVAIQDIGYRYYIVYTCIGACIPLSIYFLYPEVCPLFFLLKSRKEMLTILDYGADLGGN
jgi:hypothetical protein